MGRYWLLFWIFVILIIKGPDIVRFIRKLSSSVDRIFRIYESLRTRTGAWPIFGPESVFVRTATVNSQAIFFTSLFSMCGKLARADGKIDASEIAMMEKFIDERLQLSDVRRRMAIDIFRHAKNTSEPFRFFAENFARVFKQYPQITRLMYSLLLELAEADGVVNPDEQRLLNEAQSIFGFMGRSGGASASWSEENTYSNTHEQQNSSRRNEWGESLHRSPEKDSYDILGLPRNSPLKIVKKKYRSLVLECHPDRLVAAGVPEELRKRAEERFKEIQHAYDDICSGQS